MTRSFLALQGTASPFFNRLTGTLVSRGHSVLRINYCGGDVLYGDRNSGCDYLEHPSRLPLWYDEILKAGKFTDIFLFGDCRSIHRPIHPIAEQYGVNVHVFEEGYVRPHWLTLEKYGVNGRSKLPRDPAWYLDRRSHTPPPPCHSTGYNLYERAWHDIRYRAANTLYASRFPNYESHRPHNGIKEYLGLARRFSRKKAHERGAAKATAMVLGTKRTYYVFPLQLNSDSQIIEHSPFNSVREAIEKVMRSFAIHAPSDALLVIKNHPLDTGIVDYRRFSHDLARTLGMQDRLMYIEAGHLPTLLDHAKGVVVVNSTVGLSAVHHRRPLIALGTAIYDMAGMAWQGSIDDFWRHAEGPDMALYYAFLDYVIHHTQINGDFYTKTGIAMATAGAVQRLEASSVGREVDREHASVLVPERERLYG
ncbi:capsular biosynthesis protein [Caballeronia sp. LjRoot34]|uniref:capsule biosynthesis protein n=1 Tax=Caballeronia sp. LjRoot34 TaxID=3342325 RepID=UPI003ECD9DDA